jgi:lipopolysaccharide transport system permease protein
MTEAVTRGHDRSGSSALWEVASDLWGSRELLYQLTLRDVRIRYKQAVMGLGWALLTPAIIVLSGMVVRYAMQYLSGGTLHPAEVAGIAVKAVPWAFFVGTVGFASSSLVGNAALVTKIYFPREVLPLAATLAQAFDSSIGAVTLLIALPFFGVGVLAGLVWVPLLALLLFFLTLAVALIVSAANLFFRDVKYIVQVLLTFGIFFTPVFFEPAMLGPTWGRVLMYNPLAPLLEGIRLALVGGQNLLHASAPFWSPWYLLYSAAWSVLGLLASVLLFHRLRFLFAEYV